MSKKSFKDFLSEANALVRTMSVDDAKSLLSDTNVTFVDVRELHERVEHGSIPDSVHTSRGMLEFQICSTSPFHNFAFSEDKHFVFFCATGGRSVLAAHRASEMGLSNVSHIGGGFTAWLESCGKVEKV